MGGHFVLLADPSLYDENMQNGTMVISLTIPDELMNITATFIII